MPVNEIQALRDGSFFQLVADKPDGSLVSPCSRVRFLHRVVVLENIGSKTNPLEEFALGNGRQLRAEMTLEVNLGRGALIVAVERALLRMRIGEQANVAVKASSAFPSQQALPCRASDILVFELMVKDCTPEEDLSPGKNRIIVKHTIVRNPDTSKPSAVFESKVTMSWKLVDDFTSKPLKADPFEFTVGGAESCELWDIVACSMRAGDLCNITENGERTFLVVMNSVVEPPNIATLGKDDKSALANARLRCEEGDKIRTATIRFQAARLKYTRAVEILSVSPHQRSMDPKDVGKLKPEFRELYARCWQCAATCSMSSGDWISCVNEISTAMFYADSWEMHLTRARAFRFQQRVDDARADLKIVADYFESNKLEKPEQLETEIAEWSKLKEQIDAQMAAL